MDTNTPVSARVSRPLWFIAVLFASVVLLNALVVGCGGNGSTGGGEAASTEGGHEDMDHGDDGGEMAGGEGGEGHDGNLASATAGEGIYKAKCVLCHGPQGKGDGVGAAALNPKPADHTDGAYMNARSNEELLAVIRDGKGQMTPWGNILSDEEMNQVLAYVRTLAEPDYTGEMP